MNALIDTLLVVVVTMVGLLNFAVLRDTCIQEPHTYTAGRRLMVCAYALMSLHFWWMLFDKHDIPVPIAVEFGLMMMAAASGIECISLLQKRWQEYSHDA